MIIGAFLFLGISFGSGMSEAGSMGGALASFIVTLAIGVGIALIYYFLNRTLTLGFVEVGGVISGIRFKRSVIENLDVNQTQAKAVCVIVQRLIEAKHKRLSQMRADAP